MKSPLYSWEKKSNFVVVVTKSTKYYWMKLTSFVIFSFSLYSLTLSTSCMQKKTTKNIFNVSHYKKNIILHVVYHKHMAFAWLEFMTWLLLFFYHNIRLNIEKTIQEILLSKIYILIELNYLTKWNLSKITNSFFYRFSLRKIFHWTNQN